MPIDTFSKMEEHTVFVDNGSGVLIQPMTDAYSYVLTAKHVLEIITDEDDEPSIHPIYKDADDIRITHNHASIKVIARYLHPDKDLAVLLVHHIPGLTLTISSALVIRGNKFTIMGCPSLRRTSKETIFSKYIRDLSGEVKRVRGDCFEVGSDEVPTVKEIRGMSGGGIFVEINGNCYLTGIETSLSGVIGEYHGRLDGIMVSSFDEILTSNQYIGEDLAKILPPHLFCLSRSIPKTFAFRGTALPLVSAKARNYLHQIGTNSIKADSPTPYSLKSKLLENSLFHKDLCEQILDEDYWKCYLEYLIVGLISSNTSIITNDFITQLGSHKHFLYSDTERDWLELLPSIVDIGLPNMVADSALVIATKSSPIQAELTVPLDRIIPNIDQDLPMMFDIGAGSRRISKNTRLLHLEGVSRKAIILNEEKLDALLKSDEDFTESVRECYREQF
ncbi:ABC-three component system protein [Pseudomonas sp. CGJS7]|uniref:ABC-three component system protein n=1 Tax=Pseudomonas sp. CGJS7 TaxID=3109348 RepID=UPI0030084BE0